MSEKPYWINLLDMGPHAYGDSLLVNHPDVRILIDGGYGELADDRPGIDSIPTQLHKILGQDPPLRVDLLVVTHAHGDHVGCLPSLVERGVLEADWALVADPDLAFGPFDDVVRDDSLQRVLVDVALREEPHDHLPDAELTAFLADAVSLERRYRRMLRRLADTGTKVCRFGSSDADVEELLEHFGPLGLRVLGPTVDHLRTCSRYLARLASDGRFVADDLALPDAELPPSRWPEVYRQVVRRVSPDSALAIDRQGRGSALNDQSIVLLFESGGAKALLTGDMQLAEAEVPDLDQEMRRLVGRIADAGPFDFFKVPHHSSYNGLDREIYEALPAKIYGHTGGQRSAAHPHRDVLKLLQQRAGDLDWVRTDRNGRVGVRLGASTVRFFLAHGHRNDFRQPIPADRLIGGEAEVAAGGPPVTAAKQAEAVGSVEPASDVVEVVARIPHRATRVTISVAIEPAAKAATSIWVPAPPPPRSEAAEGGGGTEPAVPVAGGRDLPRLLFATSRRLGSAIGSDAEAHRILDAARRSGHEVFEDLPSDPEDAPAGAAELRAHLDRLGGPTAVYGIVLVGNYDVVPAVSLDVLGDLRGRVDFADHDRFVVWSDDPYGDVDGDGVPEHAVSRLPHESGSADLLWQGLTARGPRRTDERFGIRNSQRPFADDIFGLLPGSANLLVSGPLARGGLPSRQVESVGDYFMLHGSAHDATRFWGEAASDEEPGEIEAFHLNDVPRSFSGVVFTGCCWGALPATPPAGWRSPGQPVHPRTTNDSIALRYLAAGAWAVVGCTGSHYSPGAPPYTYFGAPFHQVFWTHVVQGHPPSLALLQTKRLYGASIPHITGSPTYSAVELKILQQFTCLGLGW